MMATAEGAQKKGNARSVSMDGDQEPRDRADEQDDSQRDVCAESRPLARAQDEDAPEDRNRGSATECHRQGRPSRVMSRLRRKRSAARESEEERGIVADGDGEG